MYPGRKKVLTVGQEAELVKLIREMADAGFSPTLKQVLSIVIEYWEINEIQNPHFNDTMSPNKRVVKELIWRPTRKCFTTSLEGIGDSLPPLIIYGSKANVLNSIQPEWAGNENMLIE
uniref:Uncharacterized protein n=1 Tax=Romanomermis culicivorax TaxID=13658 RepID=A0A915LB92_ROMCU